MFQSVPYSSQNTNRHVEILKGVRSGNVKVLREYSIRGKQRQRVGINSNSVVSVSVQRGKQSEPPNTLYRVQFQCTGSDIGLF